MYVALEDTSGNVSVWPNPDGNAALVTNWTSWYSNIHDINAAGYPNPVKLEAISGFAIGFGMRCRQTGQTGEGGDGNVMFDNIGLYGPSCVPAFAPTADLDRDCDVDINDMDVFANDWLWAALPQHNLTYTVPHKAPVIWYKFNESSGITAADSGPGSYDANVINVGSVVWEPTGGRDGNHLGCINLNTLTSQNTRVEVPVAAFDFMADDAHYNNTGNGGSVSFSVWINADTTIGDLMTSSWAALFSVYDPNVNANLNELAAFSTPFSWSSQRAWFSQSPVGGTGVSVYCPRIAINNYGGRWNHWAAVKSEPNTLSVYCNGSLVGSSTGPEAPFFKLPIQSFRIGMRGMIWANWGKWSGKVQDFKVYDYALDANEVGYLATDGSGVVPILPLVSPANLKSSGDPNTEIVNFGDMAIMGQQWHTQILWP
jgi:hypothetical protein